MSQLRIVVLVSVVLIAGACSNTADTAAEDTAGAAAEDTAGTAAEEPDDSAADEPVDEESVEEEPAGEDGAAGDAEVLADSGCGVAIEPGTSTVSFEFEGRDREYELYVPTSYDESTPTPVVLNWHGLGSTGPQQLAFSEYEQTAEVHGFLVAAPTGVPGPGDSRNSWELTDASDPTRDDLAFAETVMDRLIATTCVDEARIYTTGMSNGGYFSSRLICELGDRIAAAASVAALTFESGCQPERPVPYIAFHGVDDLIVPYDGGGESTLAPGVRIELFERVIPDEFGEFADAYGCDPDPESESITDEVTAFVYSGCPDGVEAIFYRLDDAGHTWPGSQNSAAISQTSGLGVTNTDVNATELSWDFFSRHELG